MAILTIDDLASFATIDPIKAEGMIADAVAIASLAAPCIADEAALTPLQIAAFRAVLRGAVLRWNEAGTGALSAQTAGPFSQTLDTRTQRRGMFWPSEIEQLQNICKSDGDDGGAFSLDTAGAGTYHADICSLNFGALYCSCGTDIAGYPIYEQIANL
jgi:hypothetical protein